MRKLKLQKGVNYEHNGEQIEIKSCNANFLMKQELKTFIDSFMDQFNFKITVHNLMINRVEKWLSSCLAESEELR